MRMRGEQRTALAERRAAGKGDQAAENCGGVGGHWGVCWQDAKRLPPTGSLEAGDGGRIGEDRLGLVSGEDGRSVRPSLNLLGADELAEEEFDSEADEGVSHDVGGDDGIEADGMARPENRDRASDAGKAGDQRLDGTVLAGQEEVSGPAARNEKARNGPESDSEFHMGAPAF